MMPTTYQQQAPIPPPSSHRREVQARARRARALHINALTLIETLHLLALCRLAVQVAHRRCPPPLPKGRGGRPQTYREESLVLIALLKTLWRLSYQDMHDWLESWPPLALACCFPLHTARQPPLTRPTCHDPLFPRPLLDLAARLYRIRPRIIRLDAGYWGLQLIHWIHATLGAIAVVPWNPKRQKNRSCLPPTWTKEELGKRSSIERFFGRVFLFFHLQRPPLWGWSAMTRQVALTYTASIIVGLAAQQAGRPELIRSPKRVLAHLWEEESQL